MVKCADCGFLASRDEKSRILDETEQITREDGLVISHLSPSCFMMVYDLWAESGTNFGSVGQLDRPKIKATIQKERECSQFTKWYQGFSAKEHREMIDREYEEKREDERDQRQRDWQDKQERLRSKDEWRRITFSSIIAVAAGVITAILAWLLAINSQIVK